MTTPAEKLLRLTTKECDALASYQDDLLRELWAHEMHECIRQGPPPVWWPERP
jgi:hypothetical protein